MVTVVIIKLKVFLLLLLLLFRQGNDKGGIQMPQSAVRSYFKEQSSAKWELCIPEDVAIEVHRWPIGFVTTGFVRGRLEYASFYTKYVLVFVFHCIMFSYSNIWSELCAVRSQQQWLYARQSYLLILERSSGRTCPQSGGRRSMSWSGI